MGRIRALSSEMHAAETALLRSHRAMVDGQRRATLVFALLFRSREMCARSAAEESPAQQVARRGTIESSMSAGAAGFMVKPFTRDALIAKMRRILSAAR
jgi:hypothetical protein